MKIGVDGRYQGQPLTGVPRYVDELCRQLDALLPEAAFVLYALRPDGIVLPSARWTLCVETVPLLARLKPNLWWKFFAWRLIRATRPDVVWCSAALLPLGVAPDRCILTVYDLTFRLYPETMSPFNLGAYRLFFAGDLKRAHRVLAISQGTSRRLDAAYGRPADAIILPDAGPQFHPVSYQERARVRRQYGLTRPYLLAVSTLEPRKNFVSLIEAFLLLRRSGKLADHELLLIGKKGWRGTALASRLAADEGGSIRSLGFVPEADLPGLYADCEVFCMPSLYEGFGMPVLEARRCGARVVTTDIPELREAGGSEAEYVSPNPAAIAVGIEAVLKRPPPQQTVSCSPPWREAAIGMVPFLLGGKSPQLQDGRPP